MLETEIKKLTAAVTRLVDLIENGQPRTVEKEETEQQEPRTVEKEETEQQEPPTAEKVETPDETTYTTDDIKSMALAISRKDRTKQKTIKAKLAEHDAKVATDLEGYELEVVGEWLADLKEELGA